MTKTVLTQKYGCLFDCKYCRYNSTVLSDDLAPHDQCANKVFMTSPCERYQPDNELAKFIRARNSRRNYFRWQRVAAAFDIDVNVLLDAHWLADKAIKIYKIIYEN